MTTMKMTMFLCGLLASCHAAFALTDDDTALERARATLSQMTLDEAASLCGGNGTMTLNAIPRVGIDAEWTMSDSSHTVRTDISRGGFAHAQPEVTATVLPTLSALAATWNTALASAFGDVIGEEARARGKDQMLGPGVNIMRTPLCGRNWEYMSEDPCLASRLVVPEIRALQRHDVAACVKHFALNGQELNRNSVDTVVDERTLNEIYLPAFRAAVKEADVLTVMTAYNQYNGQFMSENAYMLRGILRDRWGFVGSIVTDWGGQHSCALAANNGCGIEMNSGNSVRYLRNNKAGTLPLAEAVRRGEVPEATVRDMALRVLYVMEKVKFRMPSGRAAGSLNTPAHQAVARRIGEEAIVLLKNERGLLPLDPAKTKRILLVGKLADAEHCKDGWSAEGMPPYEITPAKGLAEFFAARGQQVAFDRAPLAAGDYLAQMHAIDDKFLETYDLSAQDAGMSVKAWNVDYYRKDDAYSAVSDGEKPVCRRYARAVDVAFTDKSPCPAADLGTNGLYAVRFSTRLVAPESGKFLFLLSNAGAGHEYSALKVNGRTVMDWTPGYIRASGHCAVEMEKGTAYDVVVDYRDRVRPDAKGFCRLKWMLPSEYGPEEDLRKKAEAADAVLVFTGTSVGHGRAMECEGADRPNMKMPEGMDDAVAKILSWGLPNVVVVNHSGAPVEMPWVDACRTLVQEPYLGQEAGRALANVLFGAVNPSGRLPCTWPRRYEDTAVATAGTYNGARVIYNERFYVGYRWHDKRKVAPMFPFGHGLGYAKFACSGVAAAVEGDEVVVTCRVTNEGKVGGKEVVQVYAAYPESKVERCVKELKGFAKVELAPGETKAVRVAIPKRDLAYFDEFGKRFVTEAGKYEFLVGASSEEIRGTCAAAIKEEIRYED